MNARQLLIATALVAAPVAAQQVPCSPTSGFPCQNQLDGVSLTRVPTAFRIEARVAQAKIAIPQGLFENVVVKVLRGTEMVCKETFKNVEVRQSVMNLLIGPEMSCDLGEVVATMSNLSLQVCPGDSGNCLDPMPFSTTPAAVSVSYATRAGKVNEAQRAAQAQFFRRLSSGRDVATTRTLGTGYIDVAARVESGVYTGAFVGWTPVRRKTARTLSLVGQSAGTGRLAPLRRVLFHASAATTTGHLTVSPRWTSQGMRVAGGGATISGDSSVTGALTVTAGLTVKSEGLTVPGKVDIAGSLAASPFVFSKAGAVVLSGGVDHGESPDPLATAIAKAGSLKVLGPATFQGKVDVDGTISLRSLTTGTAVASQLDLTGLTLASITSVGGVNTLVLDPNKGALRLRLKSTQALRGFTFKQTPIVLPCPVGRTRRTDGKCIDVPRRRVFVTSLSYSGNLESPSGGKGPDAKCQARADAAGLGSKWMALVSVGAGLKASTRLEPGAYIPKLVDGTLLADDSVIFTQRVSEPNASTPLRTTINQDEFGNLVQGNQLAWVGESLTTYCNGWATDTGQGGQVLISDTRDKPWLNSTGRVAACNTSARLICMEKAQ